MHARNYLILVGINVFSLILTPAAFGAGNQPNQLQPTTGGGSSMMRNCTNLQSCQAYAQHIKDVERYVAYSTAGGFVGGLLGPFSWAIGFFGGLGLAGYKNHKDKKADRAAGIQVY